MKISAIAHGDMDSATTRIRLYSILAALPPKYTWSLCKKKAVGDILYVQKDASERTLSIAERAKREGVKIVYDLGDPVEREHRVAMLALADIVTTDTNERKRILSAYAKTISVVPDCIDYEGKYLDFECAPQVQRIVTFGNTESIEGSASYINGLSFIKVYITNRESGCFDNAKFVKWKYHSFIKELAKNDVCFLAQSNDAKSNNRLLVCMRLGIPFITNDSVSYRTTLTYAGLDFLIAKDAADIGRIIKTYMSGDNDRRLEIAQAARKYVEKYSSENTAKKLAEVFECIK